MNRCRERSIDLKPPSAVPDGIQQDFDWASALLRGNLASDQIQGSCNKNVIVRSSLDHVGSNRLITF